MDGSERRQYQRIDKRVHVRLSQYDETRGKEIIRNTETRNVSAGGLLITSEFPMEISSFVQATFTLDGKTGERNILAKVVRVDEVESLVRYDIGLQFVENLNADDPGLAT